MFSRFKVKLFGLRFSVINMTIQTKILFTKCYKNFLRVRTLYILTLACSVAVFILRGIVLKYSFISNKRIKYETIMLEKNICLDLSSHNGFTRRNLLNSIQSISQSKAITTITTILLK